MSGQERRSDKMPIEEWTSKMEKEKALVLCKRLRGARYEVVQSQEGFLNIAQAIEAVGKALKPDAMALGHMREAFSDFIGKHHPLGKSAVESDTGSFAALFPIVLEARNDEAHLGASARAAATAGVRIGIMLEDAIISMISESRIENFMCETICRTYTWETLSEARRKMLAESFSWLPFEIEDGKWRLLGDLDLAKYLADPVERKKRLKETIKDAQSLEELKTTEAPMVPTGTRRECALSLIGDKAGLVEAKDGKAVVGIVTAFDLL